MNTVSTNSSEVGHFRNFIDGGVIDSVMHIAEGTLSDLRGRSQVNMAMIRYDLATAVPVQPKMDYI